MSRLAEQVGRVLGGRYRLIAPIGMGASAQVFLADDVRLRRRVAVKMLHAALADDHDFLRRFRAEAQAAAALNHPHVMSVYDWGQDDVPYLVLEYLEGGSLRAMLDRGNRLTPSQALRVGLEAGRALEYAHHRGLIHRDIKPANLLFDDDGRLRIADFGLARALAEAAWTEPQGAMLGTARYASPEQARGERLDGRADVYSLALVLVEAVSGEVPFASDTTIGTLMARVHQPMPVDANLGPLQPVLERAGTPDPAERLDAHDLITALFDVEPALPRPQPLPLAGTAADDPDAVFIDHDPTAMGPTPRARGATMAVSAAELLEDDTLETSNATTSSDTPGPADPAIAGANRDDDTALDTEPGGWSVADAGAGAGDRDGSAATPPPEARTHLRRWPYLLGVVVLLVAAGIGIWLGLIRGSTPAHPVPAQLIGLTEPQAKARVAALGWKWPVHVTHGRKDGSVVGTVIATRPRPRAKLAEGHTLTVVVSEGNTLVTIPTDLVGKPLSQATSELAVPHLLLRANPTYQYDERAPRGTVLKVGAGTPKRLPKGATVTLVVSNGPAPRTVPPSQGASPQTVVAQLDAIGLVAKSTSDYSESVPKGAVIGTNPPASAQVARGSTVAVVVSLGPRPVTVPSLQGITTLDAAINALRNVGLVPGEAQGPLTGTPKAFTPGSGATVAQGTRVDIVLG